MKTIEKHSPYPIPFNRPCLTGNELAYIVQAVEQGWVSGDGLFTSKCHALLEQALGVPKALLTPSCTDALEDGRTPAGHPTG